MPSVGYLMKADLYFIYSYIYLFMLVLNTIAVNLLVEKGRELFAQTLEKITGWVYSLLIVSAYACLTLVEENFLGAGVFFITALLLSFPVAFMVAAYKESKG